MSIKDQADNQVFSTIEARFAGQARLRHELRSALSAIIGYSEMLRQDAQDSNQIDFQREFKNLNRAGQRLLNSANSLLEASKLETGTLEFSLESLSANLHHQLRAPVDDFISECTRLLKRSAQAGQEAYVADLQKIRSEGEKLIALLENKTDSRESARPFRAVTPGFSQTKTSVETEKTAQGIALVVDDNESNLDILSRQLHREGHTVFAVRNGTLALQILRSRKIDIVLLGVILPEINGYQVLEQMKADPAWREIPVIMISAIDSLDSVVRCLEMGAEDYLAKPFNPTVLKARINACLEKKRLRDQERGHVEELRIEKEKQDELLKELAAANWEMAQMMEQLKAAQGQLVIQEKLASLGALTAGIAHEIKNPLNFINNFAALSTEIADELKDEIQRHEEKLGDESSGYIGELLGDLKQNARKIHEHGNRADSIVRSMLLHSRGEGGEWQPTDINHLLAEYINLAYHGLRAQDASFNLAIETDYDESIGQVKAVTQDLGRVFLNLLNNACYAIHEKIKASGDKFSPLLTVRTRNAGDRVEVRIRDNGSGIPDHVLDKIFNPFFTTKPPGEGTGLGLSISYEIIVQQHKGEIKVETEAGEFTEFIILIDRG